MNLYVKYHLNKTCRVLLQEQLDKLDFEYTITGMGSVHFKSNVPMDKHIQLNAALSKYGIEIIDNQKAVLVQKIKDTLTTMLNQNNLPVVKISTYLSEQLNENYRTLSSIFSEVCYISLESFIILHKIEKVKQMLTTESLSLTEISFRLHYSSVAHLSNQFKKLTGLTPTTFQKLAYYKRNYRALAN